MSRVPKDQFDAIQKLTMADFKSDGTLKNNRGVCNIMFYVDWCGHCKIMKPKYAAICNASASVANSRGVSAYTQQCSSDTKNCAIDCDQKNASGQTVLDYLHSIPELKKRQFMIRGYPTVVRFTNGVYDATFNGSEIDSGVCKGQDPLQRFVIGVKCNK